MKTKIPGQWLPSKKTIQELAKIKPVKIFTRNTAKKTKLKGTMEGG